MPPRGKEFGKRSSALWCLVSQRGHTQIPGNILSLLAEVPCHKDANIDANAGEIVLKGFERNLSFVWNQMMNYAVAIRESS